MELGRPTAMEWRSPVIGGWIEVRIYPTLAGVTAYFHDIDERKQVEEALREAEAKSKDLIRYAPTGIYEIDFNGPRFRTVNDAMCVLSGYRRDELLAINPFDSRRRQPHHLCREAPRGARR